MGRFLGPLRVEQVGANACWRLLAPLRYASEILGRVVTVPEGFVTDLASVPRLPLVYLLAGNTAHEAAILHDFLYNDGQVSRAVADRVFYEAMAATGVPWWRRWLMWAGVRAGGWAAWRRHRLVPGD